MKEEAVGAVETGMDAGERHGTDLYTVLTPEGSELTIP